MMCIAAMKTMTAAQKGKRSLQKAGIQSEIVSLDASLTKNGCAYGLKFSQSHAQRAETIFQRSNISYGDILGGY